ncbi:hypothetical protein [Actinokineospora terrae]|uniref:Uncharacterized protein n=1 Tax=Actinokineospora terrae TaxID=155974 RepID=A0A1H9VGG2_9PSEU|nr:hypothetical protein [Actinokineospora terrae]SES20866.1 hypothetical protein SAMN04487818_108356 [Actinokineospora terrae]
MYYDFFPDGLTESRIDALIAEMAGQAQPVRVPSPFADREMDLRRERRRSNRSSVQATRVLGAHLRSTPMTASSLGEVA